MQQISAKQKVLLETLSCHLPPGTKNLAKWLGEVLSIDSSNAYRRLRGETELSFSELDLITKHFPQLPLLLERMWNTERRTSADHYDMNNWSHVQAYMRRLIGSIYQAAETGKAVSYNCCQASLFITIRSEYLIRRNFGHAIKLDGNSAKEAIPAPLLRLCKELQQAYDQTDTLEIWHLNGWVNFFERLKFLFNSHIIKESELINTCTELKLWLLKFSNLSAEGKKPGGGKLVVHVSEYKELSDTILFEDLIQCHLGSSMDSAVLISDDYSKIKLVENAWHQQLAASQTISGHNPRQRNNFFNQIIAGADELLLSCIENKNSVQF